MVEVIEGFLTQDTTPAAFTAAKEMSSAVTKFNAEGGDMQVLINVLIEQNRSLVRALGKVEMRIAELDGTITRN